MNECIRDFIGKLPQNYRSVMVLSEVEGQKKTGIMPDLHL